MRFRLTYDGPLASNGKPRDKQKIRRIFHTQLADLWTRPPLNEMRKYWLAEPPPDGEVSLIEHAAGFRLAPLVSKRIHLLAGLHILLLRREDPGSLVKPGGDIDNRIKTLLDALRMPISTSELPKGDSPGTDEDPLFCLLQDDALITDLAVETDRLLEPPSDPQSKSHIRLVIGVTVRVSHATWGNMPLNY